MLQIVFAFRLELIFQVRQNRKDIDKKCPKVKCEKMLKKVKKVKTSVDFIQQTNLTELENLVTVLQDSPAGNFWKNVCALWVNIKPLSGSVNVSTDIFNDAMTNARQKVIVTSCLPTTQLLLPLVDLESVAKIAAKILVPLFVPQGIALAIANGLSKMKQSQFRKPY